LSSLLGIVEQKAGCGPVVVMDTGKGGQGEIFEQSSAGIAQIRISVVIGLEDDCFNSVAASTPAGRGSAAENRKPWRARSCAL